MHVLLTALAYLTEFILFDRWGTAEHSSLLHPTKRKLSGVSHFGVVSFQLPIQSTSSPLHRAGWGGAPFPGTLLWLVVCTSAPNLILEPWPAPQWDSPRSGFASLLQRHTIVQGRAVIQGLDLLSGSQHPGESWYHRKPSTVPKSN